MKPTLNFVLISALSLNILMISSTFCTEHDPTPPQHNSKFKPSLLVIDELPESDVEPDWEAIKPLLRQINYGGNWQELMQQEQEELIRVKE